MERAIPVAGLAQAAFQLEAGPQVGRYAALVGLRNRQGNPVQAQLREPQRYNLPGYLRPDSLTPVALLPQQNKVLAGLIVAGNPGNARVANQLVGAGQINAQRMTAGILQGGRQPLLHLRERMRALKSREGIQNYLRVADPAVEEFRLVNL